MTRRGRWTYNADSGLYGEAGWHLDGSPLVIDFMPDHNAECNHGPRRCRGEYQLHNWPGREWESLACHVREAMWTVEDDWDSLTAERQQAIITSGRADVPAVATTR